MSTLSSRASYQINSHLIQCQLAVFVVFFVSSWTYSSLKSRCNYCVQKWAASQDEPEDAVQSANLLLRLLLVVVLRCGSETWPVFAKMSLCSSPLDVCPRLASQRRRLASSDDCLPPAAEVGLRTSFITLTRVQSIRPSDLSLPHPCYRQRHCSRCSSDCSA